MGDRSNIVIENAYNTPSRVYLYSHWSGERIVASAVHGLKSGRVTDPDYLARIVFEKMLAGYLGGETGYGIGARLADNEHPVLVISNAPKSEDYEAGTYVYFEDQSEFNAPFEPVTKKISYRKFLTLIEGIENWQDLADSNQLYSQLIERMAQ